MTHLDHIAELRAELAQCILTRDERAQIESELRAALAARLAKGEQAPNGSADD